MDAETSGEDKTPGSRPDPARISYHHVGGRDGTVTLSDLDHFAADIDRVIYEADAASIAQIREVWAHTSARVVPYCLADAPGVREFHINYCPYSSSLFPFNREYAEHFEDEEDLDKLYGIAMRPQNSVRVECTSLDALVSTSDVVAPDYLSLDVQGAELLILTGAVDCLSTQCVAVMVEVSFAPLYTGAPLFGDVDAFMRTRGFVLADLHPIPIARTKRTPLAARGAGVPLQGDAVYLLNPGTIHPLDDAARARLLKLAFVACVTGHLDIAIDALEREGHIALARLRGAYVHFLREFTSVARAEPALPELWESVYSPDASAARFSAASETGAARLLAKLRQHPGSVARTVARRGTTALRALARRAHAAAGTTSPGRMEALLRQHGLVHAANSVRERRERIQ